MNLQASGLCAGFDVPTVRALGGVLAVLSAVFATKRIPHFGH